MVRMLPSGAGEARVQWAAGHPGGALGSGTTASVELLIAEPSHVAGYTACSCGCHQRAALLGTSDSCGDAAACRHLQARGGVADTLTEVSEFYSAAGPLSRRLADDSLAHWFAHLADQARILLGCRIAPATHFSGLCDDQGSEQGVFGR